jgi:hypothetical protein
MTARAFGFIVPPIGDPFADYVPDDATRADLDADELALIEHVRTHHDVAAGSLGWPAATATDPAPLLGPERHKLIELGPVPWTQRPDSAEELRMDRIRAKRAENLRERERELERERRRRARSRKRKAASQPDPKPRPQPLPDPFPMPPPQPPPRPVPPPLHPHGAPGTGGIKPIPVHPDAGKMWPPPPQPEPWPMPGPLGFTRTLAVNLSPPVMTPTWPQPKTVHDVRAMRVIKATPYKPKGQ